MIKGIYGELISETSEAPGCYGDSCAETSRYYILKWPDADKSTLSIFITNTFFIRHPESPWREDDFSTDQALPFFLATCSAKMYHQLKANHWRLPNGHFISPVFYAILTNRKWLINLCVFAQTLIFKLPWRWDDGKKKFTKNTNTSDYLNFYHIAYPMSKWARKLVSKEKMISAIESYYESELQASKDKELTLEIINLYKREIEVIW